MGNPIAENRQGLIGRPVDRVDGRLKVTESAPYAHEVREGGQALHGVIVDGRTGAGVWLVYTCLNAPKQGEFGAPANSDDDFGKAGPFLASPEIRHYAEPVAFVVADTPETARAAASLIDVRYETAAAETSFDDNLKHAVKPEKAGPGMKPDTAFGDLAAAAIANAVCNACGVRVRAYPITIDRLLPHLLKV